MDDEFVTVRLRIKKRELKHLLRGIRRVIDSEKVAIQINRKSRRRRDTNTKRLRAFTRLRTAIESVVQHVIKEEGPSGAASVFDTTDPGRGRMFDTTAPGT